MTKPISTDEAFKKLQARDARMAWQFHRLANSNLDASTSWDDENDRVFLCFEKGTITFQSYENL